jgi:hypothetical protein
MAQTVQNIIDSARYDLIDFVDGVGVGIEFDDTELLNYMNRMVGLLDAALSSLDSELVLGHIDTLLTTANLDYVDISSMNSGLWSRVRRVWRDGSNLLDQVSVRAMHYTRHYRKSLLTSGDAVAVGDYIQTITQTTTNFIPLGAADNTSGTYWTCTVAGTLGASDVVWKFTSGKPSIWALEGNKILFPTVVGAVQTISAEYDKKTAVLALTDNMPYSDRFNEFLREMLVMCAKAKKEGILDEADTALNQMFHARAMQEEISRGFIPKNYNYTEF